ncbi:MAG: siroheme synthase CysG [Methylococcaceae bacterium]
MKFFPVFLDIRTTPCLVVGGGEVAFRKVTSLLRSGASVTVLAPELNPGLSALLAAEQLTHVCKSLTAGDLAGFQLVISATNEATVNRAVHAEAVARGIPVNVVDCPELCTFIFPAVVDRSPLLIAVSTGGASPVLARVVRSRLESWLPHAYGQLASLAERFRDKVKAAIAPAKRRSFWEAVLQGPIAELVLAGRSEEAASHLERAIQAEALATDEKTGFVSLVGSGPGDPDLLTLAAVRALQAADVVVYDRLVSPEIMNRVRNDAERIYVGKESGNHTLPQDEVNRLLIALAREGKRVVRLKGGDPFIFGRGGEEIETLAEEGIAFQVIPGVTAASGCAAYAGIPLTHRDLAQSVTFLTGHLKAGEPGPHDWAHLARPDHTLVIYMGLQSLSHICAELIGSGCPDDRPAALIEQGTTRAQRMVVGTLSDLPERATHSQIHSPALIIVGEVVTLNRKLGWFVGA